MLLLDTDEISMDDSERYGANTGEIEDSNSKPFDETSTLRTDEINVLSRPSSKLLSTKDRRYSSQHEPELQFERNLQALAIKER